MVNKKRKLKITAMIPAKLGSTRLAMKNLAIVGGKPAIYYPIKAALDSGAFDDVIINAEDSIFSTIAKRYRVGFYKRPDSLVRKDTKTDEVVYDFIIHNPCDVVAWVSPIAPLQSADEVRDIVSSFIDNNLDSLMTVKDEQVHCVFKDKPVNFHKDEIFAQTQDLEPVRSFVYTLMMWRTDIFVREYEKKGHALLCGKLGFYTVNKLSSVIIKKKEDLALADNLIKSMTGKVKFKVRYDKLVSIAGSERGND